MDNTRILATLDHVETDTNGRALGILVFDDGQQLILPLERLPSGCREGTVLALRFETDESETLDRRETIRDIQSRLFGPDPGSGGR
jgi:hypothetical protein